MLIQIPPEPEQNYQFFVVKKVRAFLVIPAMVIAPIAPIALITIITTITITTTTITTTTTAARTNMNLNSESVSSTLAISRRILVNTAIIAVKLSNLFPAHWSNIIQSHSVNIINFIINFIIIKAPALRSTDFQTKSPVLNV